MDQTIITQLQQRIDQLENQLLSSNNLSTQITDLIKVSNNHTSLRIGKPDKFSGKNVRSPYIFSSGYPGPSWIKSLENIFANQTEAPDDNVKIKYAVSFMNGGALQWWEMINLNEQNQIEPFEDFKSKIFDYYEPINRELNARKQMNYLKQMGNFDSITAYNRAFSKWLLQVPSMTIAEQLYHYSQGLKRQTR